MTAIVIPFPRHRIVRLPAQDRPPVSNPEDYMKMAVELALILSAPAPKPPRKRKK